MAKLSPIAELALLDALGVVDGGRFIVGSSAAAPERVIPTGNDPTKRDTGSPFQGFFSNLVTSTTQDIQSKTILLVVAGVIGILGIFAIAKKVF